MGILYGLSIYQHRCPVRFRSDLFLGLWFGNDGHQGALRSAFLIKVGLSKEAFIATGVIAACLVDLSRLAVYSAHLDRGFLATHSEILLFATGSAFVGVFIGNRVLTKVTLETVQRIVAVPLVVIGALMAGGLI